MTSPAVLRWAVLASHVPASGSGGGMVRYTVELTRALARRDDVRLHLVTGGPAPWAGLPPDQVHPLRGPLARHVTTRSWLEQHRPLPVPPCDVVQGTKHLLPRAGGALRVLTVHDLLPLQRPGDFGLLKRHLLARPYTAALHRAQLLLPVSGATHALLGPPLLQGPLGPAVVVRLAAARPDGPPRPLAALAGRPFVLAVGDASPRKNLAVLTRAMATLRHEHPRAVLALAGPPGWGVASLGPDATALEDAGALVRLGHVSDAELAWAYAHAAAVLCPSRLEGFGLPALEARACGTPVVVSTDAALQETAGLPGLPPDDVAAWAAAISDALHGRLVAAPVPTRTWDDVAAETVAAVRDALAGRG